MKTISLLNMKGGVGKTTTSVNLATGLAMKGMRVLLVDFDPQSNTTSMYDAAGDITICDVLRGEAAAAEAAVEVEENLWLIPAALELTNTEMEIRLQQNTPQHNRLQKALAQVKDQFDYCIVDCPPIINLLTVNAIIASDLIIVPIKPDKFAVSGFSVTMQNIEQIRESWELDLDYKILFTIVNRNNEERSIIEQLSQLVGGQCLNTIVRSQPKPVAAASAASMAVIKETDKKVKVAEDLRCLVNEILETC